MAGVASVNSVAGMIEAVAHEVRADERGFVAELQAGSEEAYAALIRQYHQPIYSVIARILNDPADAADATQEVFIKIFRGIERFQGDSSLKTWIYRIALHEASNHRRWWFRHKAKDVSIEPTEAEGDGDHGSVHGLKETLAAGGETPFECAANAELRQQVEAALQEVSEPYRATLILRDLQELSYEEIAGITAVSLGTVKSRLTRGREMLRLRLRLAEVLQRDGGGRRTSGDGNLSERQVRAAGESSRSRRIEVTS